MTARQHDRMHPNLPTREKSMRRLVVAAAAVIASAFIGVAVSASPAHAAVPTCSPAIVTSLPDRTDGGNHGDWAHDQLTRTVAVCETATANAYHATVTDAGTFTTLAGQSPQAGVTLPAGITGSVSGSFTADFTTTGPLDLAALTGPPPATGTSVWVQTIVGAAWASGSSINDDWTWNYASPCEHWTDAFPSDGELPADGDITKVCPAASPTPTGAGTPTAHPTTPTAHPTTHGPVGNQAAHVPAAVTPPGSPSAEAAPSVTQSAGEATPTTVPTTQPAFDSAIAATPSSTSNAAPWFIGGSLMALGAGALLWLFARRRNARKFPQDLDITAVMPQHGTDDRS